MKRLVACIIGSVLVTTGAVAEQVRSQKNNKARNVQMHKVAPKAAEKAPQPGIGTIPPVPSAAPVRRELRFETGDRVHPSEPSRVFAPAFKKAPATPGAGGTNEIRMNDGAGAQQFNPKEFTIDRPTPWKSAPGTAVLPEIDDEVLVGFEHGSPKAKGAGGAKGKGTGAGKWKMPALDGKAGN